MLRKINILAFTFLFSLTTAAVVAQEKEKNKDIPANNETPVKNIEKVIGVWEVTGIFKGNKDITNTDTVALNNTFDFTSENKYLSYSNNERIDSGAFKLNENHSLLYLESANGHQITEYKVSFVNDQMTLQPAESASAHAQRFKYVYRRKNEGN